MSYELLHFGPSRLAKNVLQKSICNARMHKVFVVFVHSSNRIVLESGQDIAFEEMAGHQIPAWSHCYILACLQHMAKIVFPLEPLLFGHVMQC